MPIKYTSEHICEKCGKLFKWSYFEQIRTRSDSRIHFVEDVPNKTLAHSFTENDNDTYSVEVNCPYCDYDNSFVWANF